MLNIMGSSENSHSAHLEVRTCTSNNHQAILQPTNESMLSCIYVSACHQTTTTSLLALLTNIYSVIVRSAQVPEKSTTKLQNMSPSPVGFHQELPGGDHGEEGRRALLMTDFPSDVVQPKKIFLQFPHLVES